MESPRIHLRYQPTPSRCLRSEVKGGTSWHLDTYRLQISVSVGYIDTLRWRDGKEKKYMFLKCFCSCYKKYREKVWTYSQARCYERLSGSHSDFHTIGNEKICMMVYRDLSSQLIVHSYNATWQHVHITCDVDTAGSRESGKLCSSLYLPACHVKAFKDSCTRIYIIKPLGFVCRT